jgi:hypothetical protein
MGPTMFADPHPILDPAAATQRYEPRGTSFCTRWKLWSPITATR